MKAIKFEYRTDGCLNNQVFPKLSAYLHGGLILQMPLRDVKEYLVGKVEVSEFMSDDKLVNDLDVYQSKFKVHLCSALYPSPPSLEAIKQLPILALVDHDTQDKVA